MTKAKEFSEPTRLERLFGPYPGGVRIALWSCVVPAAPGSKAVRSVTLLTRRFRNPETGEWQESSVYSLEHLPVVIFALQEVLAYTYQNPLESGIR